MVDRYPLDRPVEPSPLAESLAMTAACGKVHRGHLDKCPFPADSCDLPEIEAPFE